MRTHAPKIRKRRKRRILIYLIMEESLKYIFENNNLITHVIFPREGQISIKRQGDDFYMYFDNIEKLIEYVKRNSMSLKEFESEVAAELKKYPFLKWQNKKTAKLVKKLFKDGLSVKETADFILI